ncbi:AAA family ATPase [uncultured Hymenobacter sp.]|uniref:AAA family ATPase n=1 Tax=uncultured Hymenobacter sp. TaxID=170016 RepID=UPI0035C9A611
MNEQLVVKNFGPIKDATVDFKRVTVFIGPTGGGKSTLAKLAAVFGDKKVRFAQTNKIAWETSNQLIKRFELESFFTNKSSLSFMKPGGYHVRISKDKATLMEKSKLPPKMPFEALVKFNEPLIPKTEPDRSSWIKSLENYYNNTDSFGRFSDSNPLYIPAERAFIAAIQGAYAGLQMNKIALSDTLMTFITEFELSKKFIKELFIPLFQVNYQQREGIDSIKMKNGKSLKLSASASGIQAVLPLFVVLQYQANPMGREQVAARSFLVEEPELNLYPTAQQELLNWLVEKCTKSENDLTITTHSPYLLAHLNVLLFAHQVAENHPERAEEVARIVPRESWIDPKEFAAYHVEGQQENGVRSIVNPETGLISYNGLDALATAEAAQFEKLLDINAGLEVE